MLFLHNFHDFNEVYLGVFTVLVAIGVLIHGYRNEILSWPWAIGIILFTPIVLPFYIMSVILKFRSEKLWDEKPTAMNKYKHTRIPNKWYDKGVSSEYRNRGTGLPKRRSKHDDFDGYDVPDDWEI